MTNNVILHQKKSLLLKKRRKVTMVESKMSHRNKNITCQTVFPFKEILFVNNYIFLNISYIKNRKKIDYTYT